MDREALSAYVGEFLELYPHRPFHSNRGGMGLNHCFGLYATLRHLRPRLVVESGVWRGQSSWLIEAAVPDADLVCLDPQPWRREWTSGRATYLTDDFASVDWSAFDLTESLCFFDDHQSAYARLMEMRWWGFSRALFEDNFPTGQGDSYSLRHAFAGFGHPRIQMSPDYAPRGWRAVRRRRFEEAVLDRHYDRQHVIRRPNRVDAVALRRNLAAFWELPALALNRTANWGHAWDGPYAPSTPPLFSSPAESPALADLLDGLPEDERRRELEYGYMAFVELRRMPAG